MLYGWQRHLLENMATALEPDRRQRTHDNREAMLQSKIEALEAKLAEKDRVIAEISEEYVELRNNLGSPNRPLGFPRPA